MVTIYPFGRMHVSFLYRLTLFPAFSNIVVLVQNLKITLVTKKTFTMPGLGCLSK